MINFLYDHFELPIKRKAVTFHRNDCIFSLILCLLHVPMCFFFPVEDNFLSALITDVNGANVSFKLAPTYTVYMAIRYRLSNMYRPDMSPAERAHRLTSLINKVASLIQQAIQVNLGTVTYIFVLVCVSSN